VLLLVQFLVLTGDLKQALKGELFLALKGELFPTINGAQVLVLLAPKFFGGRKSIINRSIPINNIDFFKKLKKNTLKPTLEAKIGANHRDLL
jgi:hypothetical protein